MKTKWIFALSLQALFLLTGCVTPGPGRASMPASSIDGQYAQTLSDEYQRLGALLSVNRRNDAARAMKAKAARAEAGEWIYPETRPQGSAELSRGHDALAGALFAAMDAENAPFLAKAQVNFDCWALLDDSECLRNFQRAMRSVDLPQRAARTESVFFDAQSSALSAATREKLVALAMTVRMNKSLSVHLSGSTDRGTRNPSLALRRAIAVRNVLSQMGVASDRIMVKDETHTDTILSQQSPETGGDSSGRRVDIVLEQVVGQAI